jgi:hypothetical protein
MSMQIAMQTEYPFTLPQGYLDADGQLHRDGVMRLATGFDEIAPLKDPRVIANKGYLLFILLSRVITRLGTVETLNPKIVEGLFAGDLYFLQSLYRRINNGSHLLHVACPHCQGEFDVEPEPVGE